MARPRSLTLRQRFQRAVRSRFGFGSDLRLTDGGLRNPSSGMGGRGDKAEKAYFSPTNFHHRGPLQVMCVESWAARAIVNLPIEHMFLRWRTWTTESDDDGKDGGSDKPNGDKPDDKPNGGPPKGNGKDDEGGMDDGAKANRAEDEPGKPGMNGKAMPMRKAKGGDPAEVMQEAERRHKVVTRLARAMAAGRQYGTGALLMVTKEAPLTEPLMPERIREGDLVALLPLDRYDMSVTRYETDLSMPDMLQPAMYNIHPVRGPLPFAVHPSRLLRFEGLTEPSMSGFTYYDQEWGVSVLVPAINAVLQEASSAQIIEHLMHEASVPVLSISGLRDAIAGDYDNTSDEPSVAQIAQDWNYTKSNYHVAMLELGSEEFTRVAVSFAGLADLMDRFARRVAASGRVPMTVMFGTSPIGMNATGEHDALNWAINLESTRNNMLTDPLMILDEVLARDAGLKAAPEYEWQSIMEVGSKEEAEAALVRVQAVREALDGQMIDETEGRRMLDGDPVFGALPGDPPEPEFPDELDPMDPAGNPFDPVGGAPPANAPGKPKPKGNGGADKPKPTG